MDKERTGKCYCPRVCGAGIDPVVLERQCRKKASKSTAAKQVSNTINPSMSERMAYIRLHCPRDSLIGKYCQSNVKKQVNTKRGRKRNFEEMSDICKPETSKMPSPHCMTITGITDLQSVSGKIKEAKVLPRQPSSSQYDPGPPIKKRRLDSKPKSGTITNLADEIREKFRKE